MEFISESESEPAEPGLLTEHDDMMNRAGVEVPATNALEEMAAIVGAARRDVARGQGVQRAFSQGFAQSHLFAVMLFRFAQAQESERTRRRILDMQAANDPEQRELKKIRELFDSMDEDESGALNQSEIQTLVRSMGDRMSTSQITTAMSKMDPEMTGEVSFERFVKWWRYKKQEYRRDLAKRVEDVFHIVDSDGSGQLEKNEVKQIYSKVLKALPGTIEFFPPFDLDEDFQLMQAKDLRSLARRQEVEDLTDEHNNGEIVSSQAIRQLLVIGGLVLSRLLVINRSTTTSSSVSAVRNLPLFVMFLGRF